MSPAFAYPPPGEAMPFGAGRVYGADATDLVVFTFGNFMAPFTSEFGWNRGAMSTAFATGAFAAAFAILNAMWYEVHSDQARGHKAPFKQP